MGGSLGQSGAETMLPGLLILGIVPNFKTAAGTVLLAIVPPISLLAALQYYRRGQIQVITSIILFISYFIMAFVGAYLTKNISNRTLEYVTAIYFMIISLFFFWNAHTGTYGEQIDGKKTILHTAHGIKYLIK
jgi:uncharacterized membrane protein YfcA